MKRIDLPLWSDTLCLFFCLLLFFFAVFRFSLPLWAALLLALAAAGAAAALLFLFLRARRKKRHASEGEQRAIGELAFHLAMSAPEKNAELLAKCLNAAEAKKRLADGSAPAAESPPADGGADADGNANTEGADTADGGANTDGAGAPNAAGTASKGGANTDGANEADAAKAHSPAADGPHPAPYRAKKDTVLSAQSRALVRFRFEKVTADELSPLVRAKEERKAAFAGAFTDEAKKLADSFGLRLVEAPEVYVLVKESGCMPDPLIAPPVKKNGFLQKLRAGVRRKAWRGYAFAGISLLLFSLLTIFPVYYIVTGSILLAAALLVRFFGKKD